MEAWRNELYHHGILGQKWGKKNGPPYPLGASDHSASEKKAGYKKSIGGGRNEELYNKKKIKKEKYKAYSKAYNKYSYIPTHKNYEEAVRTSQEYVDARNDYNATKKKDKLERTATEDTKYTKQQIDEHRDKMLKKYNKDKYMKEVYEKATDSQIAQDKKNRDNIKKAVIAGAAIVGVSAAIYMIYRSKQSKAITAAMSAKHVNVDDLLKEGFNLDTANKILNVKAKDGLLDDFALKEINRAVFNDLDIVFEKGQNFGRVDFNKDFSIESARKFLYMSVGKQDNETYKSVLPNRTGTKNAPINYFLEATQEIRMPSKQKTDKILNELYQDPKFVSMVEDAWLTMYKNNGYINMLGKTPAEQRKKIQTIIAQMQNIRGKSYTTITAFTDEKLHSKVSEAFAKEGYNAIADIHDIKDGLSKMPVIGLDKNAFTIKGKEVLKKRWFD